MDLEKKPIKWVTLNKYHMHLYYFHNYLLRLT